MSGLVAALVLNPLAGPFAFAQEKAPATFAELVRNTKEAESILLKSEDLHGTPEDEGAPSADRVFPPNDARIQSELLDAFAAVAKSMEPGDEGRAPEACEPLILSRLENALKDRALPSDTDAVRFALLLLREKNAIDDLTLLPLLAAHPAWAKVGYDEGAWTKKDAEGRIAVLDCPTDQYLQLVGAVRAAKGRKMKRKDLRAKIDSLAKDRNDQGGARYLAVQIEWLRALESADYDGETSFSLGPVLSQAADSKDSSPRADPTDKPTKVMSKKKKKTGGLSNRLALYAKYNSLQINLLSDEFKKFTERMDLLTAEASVVIKYKDGREDEVYDLSPQEQYRMAAKMLHKEIEELKLSGIFAGKNPTFDDVIVASVETGFIHASELDAAMGVDDVWNPKVSGWTKFVTILKKYGSTALVLIPTPYTFWASLAITLAETLISKKTAGPGEADDHGISIF